MKRFVGDLADALDITRRLGGEDSRERVTAYGHGRCGHCRGYRRRGEIVVRLPNDRLKPGNPHDPHLRLCRGCGERCRSYRIAPLLSDSDVIYAELLNLGGRGASAWVVFRSDGGFYEVLMKIYHRHDDETWRPRLASPRAILARNFPSILRHRLHAGGPPLDTLRAWIRLATGTDATADDAALFLQDPDPEIRSLAMGWLSNVNRVPRTLRLRRAGLQVECGSRLSTGRGADTVCRMRTAAAS